MRVKFSFICDENFTLIKSTKIVQNIAYGMIYELRYFAPTFTLKLRSKYTCYVVRVNYLRIRCWVRVSSQRAFCISAEQSALPLMRSALSLMRSRAAVGIE